jgi:hypothetical protein
MIVPEKSCTVAESLRSKTDLPGAPHRPGKAIRDRLRHAAESAARAGRDTWRSLLCGFRARQCEKDCQGGSVIQCRFLRPWDDAY